MRIGVVAENPSDFVAVAKLLKPKFADYTFFQLIKRFTGSQLDDTNNNHVLLKLIQEIQLEQPDFFLYIRDLDALITDENASEKRITLETHFKKFAKQRPGKSIFMLNIYELEALILADFESLKTHFKNTHWEFDVATCADIAEPKEVLKNDFKLSEAQIREVFPALNIEIITKNHRFFAHFLVNFEKMLENQNFNAIL